MAVLVHNTNYSRKEKKMPENKKKNKKNSQYPVFRVNREPTGSSYDVKRNNVCGWAMPCLGTVIDRLPPMYEMYDRKSGNTLQNIRCLKKITHKVEYYLRRVKSLPWENGNPSCRLDFWRCQLLLQSGAIYEVLHKLENIEKAGTRINKCKFAKNRSIRATLFKDKLEVG